MANEETPLRGMTDKLIETGRSYGMEMNVEKTKVVRISRKPSQVTIMIEQKQLENVECFKYLGSMLTNDGRCTWHVFKVRSGFKLSPIGCTVRERACAGSYMCSLANVCHFVTG